jgi:uncharacterized protein (DUF2147 family)
MSEWTAHIGLVAASLFGSLAAGQAHAADSGATGQWVVQDGKAAIDIEPCGDKLCGTIAWLKTPLNEQGKPKTDIHNSDEALRARPLCGLKLLWDFLPDGAGAWSDGRIYDAEHGDVYHSNMQVEADRTLIVRGYVGFSFLGKSQTWTRPPAPLPHCT